MKAPAQRELSKSLSDGEKAALITLLADEDPSVYRAVRGKILEHGEGARGWVGAHRLSADPLLRRRAQEILDHLDRHAADNQFLAFCLRGSDDLQVEEGIWLLARTRYPQANAEAYAALMDSHAGELRERIDFGANAEQIIAAINHYLFVDLEFAGNERDYYDPDNSYLNRVMDRRTGNPISLCLVYLLVARRLRLPIAGIGMPGHFICRFQSSVSEYYIDAFNRGKLLSKADCVKYLTQSSHGFQETFLAPASPRQILLRVCSNLHQIYQHLEQPEETARLQRYIVALAR
jgi:regulator of sirC expression with transglutaminase-like and TPR domain